MDGDQLFELPDDDPRPPHPSRQQGGSSGPNGNGKPTGEGVPRDRPIGRTISTIPVGFSGTEERLSARLDSLAEAVRAVPDAVREDLEAELSTVRADLEVVESLPRHVARALQVVRAAVGEIADSQDGVGERMGGIEAALTGVREEMGALAAAVQERMGRVDRLADVIESLGRRRGFRDLVQSEQAALEQQEEHVARLVAASEALGGRIDAASEALSRRVRAVSEELDGRVGSASERLDTQVRAASETLEGMVRSASEALDGRVEAAAGSLDGRLRQVEAAVSEVGAQLRAVDVSRREELEPILKKLAAGLSTAFQELRQRLGADLAAGISGVRAELEAVPRAAELSENRADDLAATQRELDETLQAARAELVGIRKRMDSWGRARSAPRLADEVTGLEERVAELERSVREELTDAVAARMETHLDRRFEALVQLIESRITALSATNDDERHGLFRRR